MKRTIILLLAAMLLLSGCTAGQEDPSPASELQEVSAEESSAEPDSAAEADPVMAAPFADLRGAPGDAPPVLPQGSYSPDDLYTYTFNERTVFEGAQELAQQILEQGKNPGLGIRALQQRGITGQGVSVAVIDQNLLLEPPEYTQRVAAYYECEYDFSGTMASSMHGPAVLSLLAGETAGVAPGARVYYAAAPAWTGDAVYFANGLNWIVDLNETLPAAERIRVVSISSAPSGDGSPFDENQELYDAAVARAQAAGILVIDCRMSTDTGFVSQGFYDPWDPDNMDKVRSGLAGLGIAGPSRPGTVTAPCDFRTTVEQYFEGEYFYRYGGAGGLSWGVPWAAGVLALGWQVNPDLTADEMKALLFETAYEGGSGEYIIHPAAFVAAVEATL